MDIIILVLLAIAFCLYIYKLFFTTIEHTSNTVTKKKSKQKPSTKAKVEQPLPPTSVDTTILFEKPEATSTPTINNNSSQTVKASPEEISTGLPKFDQSHNLSIYLSNPQLFKGERLFTLIDICGFKPSYDGNYQYIVEDSALFTLSNGDATATFSDAQPEYFETDLLKFSFVLDNKMNNLKTLQTMLKRIALFQKYYGGEIMTSELKQWTQSYQQDLEQRIIDFQGYGN